MAKAKKDPLSERIALIAGAVHTAKAKTIKRINKQLALMSPNDVLALERLIGKR